MSDNPSVHASAVKVGGCAVLIRGPSGSGKSRLAFDLILSGRCGQLPPAILVGDDHVLLDAIGGELRVRPVRELAGLIEIRGLGIRRCEFTAEAKVGLIVDLAACDAERLPPPEALETEILGTKIPRVAVGKDFAPLPLVVAALTTANGLNSLNHSPNCFKGIGNHITPTLATE
jgi:HPr kinase/phosphorylase